MINDATYRPRLIDSGQVKASRVATVIAALETMSLAGAEGELLGSEADLLARFGVSRPTLRQAAKVVEAERLITIRRGLHGGFYAARPTAPDAIRTAALYLRLKGAEFHHIFQVSRMLSTELAGLAALCADQALKTELSRVRTELAGATGGSGRVRDFIETDFRFMSLVARMADNPIMMLFWQIGVDFGDMERELRMPWTRDNRVLMRSMQIAICDAILAGDPEHSRAVMQQRVDLLTRWVEHLGQPDRLQAAAGG